MVGYRRDEGSGLKPAATPVRQGQKQIPTGMTMQKTRGFGGRFLSGGYMMRKRSRMRRWKRGRQMIS